MVCVNRPQKVCSASLHGRTVPVQSGRCSPGELLAGAPRRKSSGRLPTWVRSNLRDGWTLPAAQGERSDCVLNLSVDPVCFGCNKLFFFVFVWFIPLCYYSGPSSYDRLDIRTTWVTTKNFSLDLRPKSQVMTRMPVKATWVTTRKAFVSPDIANCYQNGPKRARK
jgi:hypothetical protein